ncbi:hypothetical protein L9F63_025745, partial [Diploptera punctata]
NHESCSSPKPTSLIVTYLTRCRALNTSIMFSNRSNIARRRRRCIRSANLLVSVNWKSGSRNPYTKSYLCWVLIFQCMINV